MLRQRAGDGRHLFVATCLVGRGSHCGLRLKDAAVSAHHAELRRQGGRWMLRDLGSRNGCFINGMRVAGTEPHPLAEGDVIGFGELENAWVLEAAEAPTALALREPDGELRRPTAGMLVLPTDEQPSLCVLETAPGMWIVESSGDVRPAEDREVVEVDGERWRILVPDELPGTADVRPPRPRLDRIRLRLAHSADEEHVRLAWVHRGEVNDLPPRRAFYTLLVLARARLADEARVDLSSAESGWLFADRLCRDLRIDETKLRVDIHRIRRLFSDAGILGAPGIIERRPETRQLRLALADIEIERL